MLKVRECRYGLVSTGFSPYLTQQNHLAFRPLYALYLVSAATVHFFRSLLVELPEVNILGLRCLIRNLDRGTGSEVLKGTGAQGQP